MMWAWATSSRPWPTPPGARSSTSSPIGTARPSSSSAIGWPCRHQISSSRQAISQHLDLLEAAGLVETRRDGRYKFHHFDTAPLEQIVDRWLA